MKLFKKRLVLITVAVLFLWLGLKYGSWVLFTNKSLIYKFFAVTRFHCMMIGGLGAILFFNNNKWFLNIVTSKFSQMAAWVIFLFSGFFMLYLPAVLRAEAVAIISLFLIMSQVEGKAKFINLENRFFDFIGKISYGIYIIHPLLIYLLSKFYVKSGIHLPPILEYVFIYFLVISATVFMAWLSYKFYEKPFLKLKSRFAIIKSSNSMKI